MRLSESELDRLEELLAALPQENVPMSLSELDGFITGLLTCPDVIAISEWMPVVWGTHGDARFPDLETASETIELVIAHYNALAEQISGSRWLAPIYGIESNSGATLWEPWINGFTSAQGLRPKTWTNLYDRAGEEVQSCLQFIMALHDIYWGEDSFDTQTLAEIDESAPDIIPNCVATILRASRPELFHRGSSTPASRAGTTSRVKKAKADRNDPCPCGSGRKYKVCCGAH